MPCTVNWAAKSGHGGAEYEMILDDEGELLFQLHKLDGDEHGMNLSDPSIPRGMGVLLYVHVPDVQVIFEQAQDMKAVIESEPTFIELVGHTECIATDCV